MKTSRFTESQIIAVLKQAEGGAPVPELCREHGMSSATFYKWRSKFGGMETKVNGDPTKHSTVDVASNTPRKTLPANRVEV